MKKKIQIIVCYVSTVEKHLQSNRYKDLLFFLSHWPKNKVVYFLIQVFYFLFRLICITVAKKAVFVNNFARKSELR